MARNSWKYWLKQMLGNGNRTPFRKNSRVFQANTLQLEHLEDRAMLSSSPFTPGDLAVVRVGGTASNGAGSSALVDKATAVFIDEYTQAGTYVQTISLPTTSSGSNNPFTLAGNAVGEGQLNLSTNGQYLLMAGFNSAVNANAPDSSSSSRITIAEINGLGVVDTSTVMAAADSSVGGEPRAAFSADGTNIYFAENSSTSATGGVRYVNGLGSTASTNLSGASMKNARDVQIFNGQLYFGQSKVTTTGSTVVEALGTGMPTTTNQSSTGLNGTGTGTALAPGSNSKTNAFFFAKVGNGTDFTLGSTDSGFNTLYITDAATSSAGSTTPGLTKYSWNSSNNRWVSNGTIGTTTSLYQGLTGTVSGTTVTLYATNASGLVKITDSSGFAGTLSGTPTVLASNPTYTNYLGVAFTPSASALAISGLSNATIVSSAPAANITGGNASFADTLTSSQLNSSSLTVSIVSNADNTKDILGITNQGSNSGQIGLNGSSITFGGTTIGSVTGGSAGNPLVITLNSSSTAIAVQSLINQINFQTSSGSTAARTVQFTFTPSTGNGDPVSATETVSVILYTPAINPGSNLILGENHSPFTVSLTGINDGESDGNINVTGISASVTSGSGSLFSSGPSITNYNSNTGSANLGFTVATNQTGSATITVTVTNSLNNSATATFNVTVNPIVSSINPPGIFTGNSITLNSSNLSTTEAGVSSANIVYTLTGNPVANGGNLSKNGVPLATNSTFTQADINNNSISFQSTGSTSTTVTIPYTISDLTNGGSLPSQTFTLSVVNPGVSPGNLAVMQLGVAGSTNTTGTVLYLNPTITQATPVHSYPISSMSFSDSGTSSFLSDTNDNSLLAFAAYNTTTFPAGSDLGTDNAPGVRAVGTLDSNGNFNLATTYTDNIANASTTEQTRSATSLDNTTWYITDKDGLYTNNSNNPGGPAGPSLSTNILVTRAFGGVVYVASTKASSAVSTLSSPTTDTLVGLPGLAASENPNDTSIQDFYLIQSGTNGNTYDILYTIDQTGSVAYINKYSLVADSWVANGSSYTLPQNATAMIAANNGNSGASLYVVTTVQAANNSVVELTDSAGWNSPLAIQAAPVIIYTTPGTTSLKGIAFAPASLPNFSVGIAGPSSAAVGSQFNYTLTASNAGPANATGVSVQFTLPAGLTYAGSSLTNGFTASQVGQVVTFSNGTLNANSSAKLTISVIANSPATLTVPVGAVVIDPDGSIPQGRLFVDNYNTSSVSTQITNEADLTVEVSNPQTAYTNQAFNYILTASNIGTAPANGDVIVRFTLPSNNPGLHFVSASGAGFTVNQANGVVTFSGGTLAAGSSETLIVTVIDTTPDLVVPGAVGTHTATVVAGAAIISTSDNIPESSSNQASTLTGSTLISSPFSITGVNVSPVVDTPFTGVVATFQNLTTNPGDYSAEITWENGHTTPGIISFTGNKTVKDINGNPVTLSLLTVAGNYTYSTPGNHAISVVVTDSLNNSATVGLTAHVAYAPLVVSGGKSVHAVAGTTLSNQVVATFTDPGLVANLVSLGIADPANQFNSSINWGDGSSTSGAISFDSNTGVFTVKGSHAFSSTGSFGISVSVTPLTVSVERIDSSDPYNLNLVGDESQDINGLTDSPCPDFIDQFVIGSSNQGNSLYTFSLPTVATSGGNEALTNASYSVSEGQLTLSTNGQYLVTAGYNQTVSLWAPQQTFSSASVVNRVIGTISGSGVINTTTALTDAYSGDNFRGAVSTDGNSFWTSGHSTGAGNDFVHYATLGSSTSTILTGTTGIPNINNIQIINGQLYVSVRSASSSAPAGIYQVGTGLPTGVGQEQNLFILVPQTNPLDITAAGKTTSPFGFYMANLNNGNPTINGVNVAYVADGEMGIARYDHTNSGWQFSYYINSIGSFLDNTYTVDPASGNLAPTSNFDPDNTNNDNADLAKAGGVRQLTGRVVNGQVQLFAVTGLGTTSQPNPGQKLIEVTDTGANSGYVTLTTATGASELSGVAFTPTQTVISQAQVINLATPDNQTNGLGDNTIALQLNATGLPSGAGWTYSANGLPGGLTLNPATGLISGTITGNPGVYTATVSVNDGQGDTAASQPFTWTVLALPMASALQNVSSGMTRLALFNQVSGYPSAASYSATVNWGDGFSTSYDGVNPAVTISVSGGVVSVSGIHTYNTTGIIHPVVTLTNPGGSGTVVNQAVLIDVAADVSGCIKATSSAIYNNPVSRLYTSTVTVANTGLTNLSGEFYLALQGLTAGVSLQTATISSAGKNISLAIDMTPAGYPLVVVPQSLKSFLGAGQSMQISLGFKNPSNALIRYTPKFYSDPGQAR